MNYTLYILKSLSSDRLYIGQTNNFARRLKQHQDDRSYSTKGRGPWEVLKTICNRFVGPSPDHKAKAYCFLAQYIFGAGLDEEIHLWRVLEQFRRNYDAE